jgi:hypothetical protein
MNPILKRALVSASLCAFFLIVYGGCEAITATRSGIPSFYFAWERRIPFIAIAIIPYMSIDLFFVAGPFLIRSDRELRVYATRVLAAILVAGLFFLFLPLRFAFVRPIAPGRIGFFFTLFQRADLPFNQLPSLHIALLLIVGDAFVRRARGWTRAILLLWFFSIAASPLLTFQHHVVDLFSGFALGLLCLNFISGGEARVPFGRNNRVGFYYAIAAVAVNGASVYIGKESWPLWWPALSLTGVAVGYLVVGPCAYGKRNGQLSLTARCLFWPTLLGQHASLHWYARRAQPYDKVDDRLWIGRQLSHKEAQLAGHAGVGAVIDLTCEFCEARAFRSLPYLNLPTLDLTAPTPEQIALALAFIREHQETSTVYVHCKAGYSRTAVIAETYLLTNGQAMSVDEAAEQVAAIRPSMIVRPEARQAIQDFFNGLKRVQSAANSVPNARQHSSIDGIMQIELPGD